MKNSNKTRFLNQALPQQRLISNRREKMKKLILFMVMAALMLWSPILAEAKEKNETKAKNKTETVVKNKAEKHHKHGKPFMSLQEQINDIEYSIEGIEDTIYGTEFVPGFQDQINSMEQEHKNWAHDGGTTATYYTVRTLADVYLSDNGAPFESPCKAGDKVISGGWAVGRSYNGFAGTVRITANGPKFIDPLDDPDLEFERIWEVYVAVNPDHPYPAIPVSIEVIAVCIGQ